MNAIEPARKWVVLLLLLLPAAAGCSRSHSGPLAGGGTEPQQPAKAFIPFNPGTVTPAYGAVAGGTPVTVVLPLGFSWKAGASEIYFLLDGMTLDPAGKAGKIGFDPEHPWFVTCLTPPSVTGDRLVADVVLLPEGIPEGGVVWPPKGAVVLDRAYTYMDPLQAVAFGARRTYTLGPMAEPEVLDCEGDGDPDLVGLDRLRRNLVFAKNDGSGGFTPGPVVMLPPAHPDWPEYTGLAAGDVDLDGLADLVVFGQAGYLYLRNDPAAPGTFIQTLSNDFRRGVAGCLAEMNGDLFPDLVIGGIDAVRIFPFDPAAGMFAPIPVQLDTTLPLRRIAVGDLDGDGDGDVVTLTNDRIIWYLAKGALQFEPAQALYLAPPAANALVGRMILTDLNQDGRADVVITAADMDGPSHPFPEGVVGVALADGTGGFLPPAYTSVPGTGRALTGALDVGALDFDGDGLTDLAVTAAGWNEVLCFRGDGAGGLGLAGRYAVGAAPEYLAVLDGEGDGTADLAVMETETPDGTFSYLEGLFPGDGSAGMNPGLFRCAVDIPLPVRPIDAAQGDLDGDGLADLVVIQEAPPRAAVLRNTGAGFDPLVEFPVEGDRLTGLALVRADGDAFPDLAVTADLGEGTPGRLLLYGNDGTGLFSGVQVLETGAGPSGVRAGDVNNDGIPDLVVSQDGEGRATVFKGDGKGHFQLFAQRPGLSGSRGVLLADLDGDADLDGVLPSPKWMSLYLLLTDKEGAGILQEVPEKTFVDARGAPSVLAVLDFDLDGFLDLAANDVGSSQVLLLHHDGFLGFTPSTPVPLHGAARLVGAVDLDFDHVPDLCAVVPDRSGVEFLRNQGGAFQALFEGVLPVNRSEGTNGFLWMDLDGDVLPDLVVLSKVEKKLTILFNRSE